MDNRFVDTLYSVPIILKWNYKAGNSLYTDLTGKAMPRLTHMHNTTHGFRNYNSNLLSYIKDDE